MLDRLNRHDLSDEEWERLQVFHLDGLWAGCDEAEGKDWTVSADSTVCRGSSTHGRDPPRPGRR